MAKRKSSTRPAEKPSDSPSDQVPSDQNPADESPKVRSAADAVARAEAELKHAKEAYDKVCREANERLQAMRKKSIGDLIDGTLEAVKKHPGPGVFVAMVIGFFLGRLFRR